jgi:hypothetical protein
MLWPKGDVRDVVHQRGGAHDARLVLVDAAAALGIELRVAAHGVDQHLAHVQCADRVLEATVPRPRKDEVCQAELTDVAKALHLAGVEQAAFVGGQVDVAMDGVADDKALHGGSLVLPQPQRLRQVTNRSSTLPDSRSSSRASMRTVPPSTVETS